MARSPWLPSFSLMELKSRPRILNYLLWPSVLVNKTWLSENLNLISLSLSLNAERRSFCLSEMATLPWQWPSQSLRWKKELSLELMLAKLLNKKIPKDKAKLTLTLSLPSSNNKNRKNNRLPWLNKEKLTRFNLPRDNLKSLNTSLWVVTLKNLSLGIQLLKSFSLLKSKSLKRVNGNRNKRQRTLTNRLKFKMKNFITWTELLKN